MTILLIILHVTVSIAMIAIVLLQSGKGAEMGASFGAGGSQSVFGASGGSTFMSKLTTAAAIIFMLTSLTLAYRSSMPGSSSIMSSLPKQPAQKTAPPATAPMGSKPTESPAKPASGPQPTSTPVQPASGK